MVAWCFLRSKPYSENELWTEIAFIDNGQILCIVSKRVTVSGHNFWIDDQYYFTWEERRFVAEFSRGCISLASKSIYLTSVTYDVRSFWTIRNSPTHIEFLGLIWAERSSEMHFWATPINREIRSAFCSSWISRYAVLRCVSAYSAV